MKINLRWLVQALAFIGCIFFFLNVWNKSKEMLVQTSGSDSLFLAINGVFFLFCFFLMAVTSYLKQKDNGTLKKPIPFFEKLLSKLNLT
ncbi:MAG: hypothetical protein ACE5IR_21880 [bacterium]